MAGEALVARLMAALETTGACFALLHHEDEIARGYVGSDVDVAVSTEPRTVLRHLSEILAADGIGPVLLWPYDRGSLTSFWTDQRFGESVQLDFLYDPAGLAKYGLRTGAALFNHSVTGKRYKRLSHDAELAYLISKRWLKGDRTRLTELRESTNAQVELVARNVLSAQALWRFESAIAGKYPGRLSSVRARFRSTISMRLIRRLIRPIGVVVGVVDAGKSRDLHAVRDLLTGVALDVKVLDSRSAGWLLMYYRRRPYFIVRRAEAGPHDVWCRTDGSGLAAALMTFMHSVLIGDQ